MQTMQQAFEFSIRQDWLTFLISLIVTSLFIWLAARLVIDRSSFLAAILTALVGNFLAFLVWGLVGDVLGIVLAVLTWGLAAALFFRTAWTKGLIIGVVAWILFALVVWVLGLIR